MKAKSKHILEEENMWWYYIGQLISLSGLMARSAVLSLLIMKMVGEKQGSYYVGLVRSTEFIVGTFIGVFVGIMLDSFDKRRVLQITSSLMILQAAALALITYNGPAHTAMWAIMAVSICGSFTSAVDGIGRNAVIRDALINKDHAGFGSAIFTSLYTFAMLAGNGLAGYLVDCVGYSNAFLLNGASFLILIFSLGRMDFSHHKIVPNSKNIPHRVAEGMRYTFKDEGIRFCILLSAMITVFGFAYNVLLPVINQTMFHGDHKQFSYLALCSGVGSLFGAILALSYGVKRAKEFGMLGSFIGAAGYILVACTTNVNYAAVAMFLCGFGFMASFTPIRGALQRLAKDGRLNGVTFGIAFMFFYGGMALSSFASGWLAEHFGCPKVLIGCGIAIYTVGLLIPIMPGAKKLN